MTAPAVGQTPAAPVPAAGTTWKADGLCAQTDPEAFFPELGHTAAPARRVCLACPVRVECLEYAIDHGERGIWGGTTENQRKAIRRARETERGAAA